MNHEFMNPQIFSVAMLRFTKERDLKNTNIITFQHHHHGTTQNPSNNNKENNFKNDESRNPEQP
jgi:hypothetical protein